MGRLVIKLNPKERLLVNGAILENGDKRCRLTVLSKDSRVLRLKDAIDPQTADTPVKRAICFTQFLVADADRPIERKEKVKKELERLETAFRGTIGGDIVKDAQAALNANNTYGCLKLLKALLPLESNLLSPVRDV